MTAPAALAGIRVLDLSRVLAGPWSTQILADLGADVVKVEVPGRGDDTRAWGPPFLKGPDGQDEIGTSAYYLAANRNKRSIAVDFASSEGAALLRELALKADIVIENFKVGGLKKYGLDWESLRAVKPSLVYCSVTGFGQTGPYASRGGYDFVAQGMGGFMAITGEAGGQPLRAGVAMADVTTGLYATISILAALRHAERTGEGQQIDISLDYGKLAGNLCQHRMPGKHACRCQETRPNALQTSDASEFAIRRLYEGIIEAVRTQVEPTACRTG